ncbi:unnamed protein product [Brachionus calyciflorus]|uniref:Uncharacterized protein n=1 Tax=Brachionus calyciflorus TaxID=104777 RepID=A0A814QLS4_9BILA|nr:unnamed protein product [Brachionus calyciflorus]
MKEFKRFNEEELGKLDINRLQKPGNKKHVKKIEANTESEDDTSFGKIWRLRLKDKVMSIKDWLMPMVVLCLSGTSLNFGVDTDAHLNIIDERCFKKLKFRPRLFKSKSRLYAYVQENCIGTIGSFNTRIKFKEQYSNIVQDTLKDKLIRRFPVLFSGKICMLKGHQVDLQIDESVKPIQQQLRPV